MYTLKSKRWGNQNQQMDQIDLLAKKDQQIRRLQTQVQQQRRKADNALKMLQSYKNVNSQSQQASEGLRSQITRRIKAQQQVKKLKLRNQKLENGIKQYLKILQGQSQNNTSQSLHIINDQQQ